MATPNERAVNEYERGLQAVDAGRTEEALAIFKHAAEIDPTFLMAQVGIATAYLDLQQVDQALQLLQRIEAQQPTEFAVLYALGSIYATLEEFDTALEMFDRAADHAPKSPDAYLMLSDAYAGIEALDDAFEMAEAAVAQDPHSVEALTVLGRLHLHDEDQGGALEVLRKAVRLDPQHVPALFSLGTALIGLSQFAEARTYFDQAIAADPDFAMAYLGLATAFAAEGNTADALVQARQARVRGADDPDTLFGVAQLYLSLEHLPEARALIDQVLEVAPDFPDAQAFRYLVLMAQGETDAAAAALQTLRQIDPDLADDAVAQVEAMQRPQGRGKGKTAAAPAHPAAPAGALYQLKITLRGSKPPIWRRVLVPGDVTLDKLHAVIQAVMGWENAHLHAFRIGNLGYADPAFGLERDKDEHRTRLCDVVTEGSKFTYEYDFGDSWVHAIAVEKVLPPDPAVQAPVCIAGKLAAPPEDSGGLYGFYEMLETLQDPNAPEYEELHAWAGAYNPEVFDIDAVNARLAPLR